VFKIAHSSLDPGLKPVAAAARGMRLQTVVPTVSADGEMAPIGTRLRHARLTAGMHMKELAEAAGCSESFVSKVEGDKVRPSLVMLHRFASALGLNMSAFFSDVSNGSDVQINRAGQGPKLLTRPPRQGPGIMLEGLMAPAHHGLLQVNIHHVEPNGASEGTISHKGEEFGYVLAGTMDLYVDGQTFRLNAGDSFAFPSELPHGYANAGLEPLSILWINTPPTF
jgi:transcriptional regulator with XRE-family HTH domain